MPATIRPFVSRRPHFVGIRFEFVPKRANLLLYLRLRPMNVDYLFYRKPNKPGPYSLDDLGDIAPPIGPGDVVRAGIARVFEQIDWQESPDVPGAWFGTGGAVFQFTAEPDGRVTSFMGSRLERRSMLQLTREMGLIALDLQRDIVYG
ncbi:UNVERIFIED_ORG: hypothetical protein J2811_002913 [Burkholderia cepacia]|jgi:hypothetical protein|nr:hypothetical protein [Burkholderia cepacia]MDP9595800.1 hypothetical protein [Burkholderia cepacia]MDP9623466.1 hypothetical protein [Burkholderia cepacia]MDP9670008.1 hypothetical protein [Burkholderia cepacia]MDP9716940.1 hypothetical protein [Burkholderia cepacia]